MPSPAEAPQPDEIIVTLPVGGPEYVGDFLVDLADAATEAVGGDMPTGRRYNLRDKLHLAAEAAYWRSAEGELTDEDANALAAYGATLVMFARKLKPGQTVHITAGPEA